MSSRIPQVDSTATPAPRYGFHGREPWTPKEDRLLQAVYQEKGLRGAIQALPHRTPSAVTQRANRLKLRAFSFWKPEEETRLRNFWGIEEIESIARILGRTVRAVHHHATRNLGLAAGCPPGWEPLTTAAERTGYSYGAIQNILREAGVVPIHSYSAPFSPRKRESKTGRKTSRQTRRWIVPISAVDAAVEERGDTETLHGASQSRGVSSEWLRPRLIAYGVKPPKGKGKKVWRIPTDTIDEAIAAWDERMAKSETLIEAAKRHGVNWQTLSIWLKRNGVLVRRHAYLLRTEVDRVIRVERARPGVRAFQGDKYNPRKRKDASV